jgi:hypothetical protein
MHGPGGPQLPVRFCRLHELLELRPVERQITLAADRPVFRLVGRHKHSAIRWRVVCRRYACLASRLPAAR